MMRDIYEILDDINEKAKEIKQLAKEMHDLNADLFLSLQSRDNV